MEIVCHFGHEEWTLSSKSVYTCTVTSCYIKNKGLVAEFKAKHAVNRNNQSVRGLKFENTIVHYMPRNLAKIFPNLIYLEIKNCELQEISAEDLAGLKLLQDLSLEGNNITTLPEDIFKNMKQLKEVGLSKNLIQKFDVNILKPIKETIESFHIENNPGINEVFQKNDNKIDDFIERLKESVANKEDVIKNFEKMSKRFENLFETKQHADFMVTVEGNEYPVHKCILASQSAVFDKMFAEEEGDTKDFVKTKSFNHETFKEFIRYFYNKAVLTEKNAVDLLELAADFVVPDLKLHCESILSKIINPENAREIYNLAARHSLYGLMQKAFEVINKCNSDVAPYLHDKPKVVNAILTAKEEFQVKKIKLEKNDE